MNEREKEMNEQKNKVRNKMIYNNNSYHINLYIEMHLMETKKKG